jgi:hypothetical protein
MRSGAGALGATRPMPGNPACWRKVPSSLNKSGALARTTDGATLLPLCALARSNSPGAKRIREEHRLTPRGACLVAASYSWPLFGVRLSADSRIGPLSDPSGACRKCTKASLQVALRPAQWGLDPDSEAAHRPSAPASMRAGGRPSRAVCGPSHGVSATANTIRRDVSDPR